MNNTDQTIQDILGVKFTWYDYSFFILMLIISAIIGIYYGFYKKQQTAKDYLLGGNSMNVLPVALSLTANNISGITLLAVPSDVYKHGISYWFTYVSIVCVIFASYKIFVPVFANLQTASTFQYLKFRFDTRTRLLGSTLYLIAAVLYLPIVIYVPSLALAQATGLNLHFINILICVVCIFYTSIGGLKAVIYSDALQSVVIIGSLAVAFVLGVIRCGGLLNVWNTSYENDRLTQVLDIDFTRRNGFWAATIGQFITWMSYLGVNQVYIQKCLSLPSNTEVMKVLIIFAFGMLVTGSLCNFMGLVMYTEYSDCDPLKAGILRKQDQLLPYYIMDISKQVPGLAGLFIAGIFSAALSTLAGILNSLSCTVYQDFISHRLPKDTSEQKISVILKVIVVIVGIVCTMMVFIVEKLGGMLALTNSLSGITSGPIMALFVSGMMIPAINAKGAYYGSLLSMLVMSAIVFTSQWYQNNGYITTPPLPVSIEGCSYLNISTISINDTLTVASTSHNVPYIFKVPFYWYTSMGLIMSISFGLLISKLVKTKKTVKRDLLSPVIHRFLSKKDEDTLCVSEKLIEFNTIKPVNVTETNDNTI